MGVVGLRRVGVPESPASVVCGCRVCGSGPLGLGSGLVVRSWYSGVVFSASVFSLFPMRATTQEPILTQVSPLWQNYAVLVLYGLGTTWWWDWFSFVSPILFVCSNHPQASFSRRLPLCSRSSLPTAVLLFAVMLCKVCDRTKILGVLVYVGLEICSGSFSFLGEGGLRQRTAEISGGNRVGELGSTVLFLRRLISWSI